MNICNFLMKITILVNLAWNNRTLVAFEFFVVHLTRMAFNISLLTSEKFQMFMQILVLDFSSISKYFKLVKFWPWQIITFPERKIDKFCLQQQKLARVGLGDVNALCVEILPWIVNMQQDNVLCVWFALGFIDIFQQIRNVTTLMIVSRAIVLIATFLTLIGTKYSRMDQVKFVEESL